MITADELLARERIKDVKARYCRTLDAKDWVGFGALFTEDAVLDVSADTGQEPFRGRSVLLAVVQRAVENARTAHQVHSPEFVFDGQGAADVIWAMQDRLVWQHDKSPIPPTVAITGYGHYRERYIRAGGDWFIALLTLTRLLVEPQQG